MTQANKGDGWTLDISKARSGGPGTESNRARAARGGHGPDVLSVYLDGRRIAGAPVDLSGPFFDPADIEQARAIGVDHASGPDKTAIAIMLYRRPDGALIARGSDGVDRVTKPGEIRTPEDADRLFGAGFGLGRWMRENAGAAVFKVDDLTPAPAQPDTAPGQVWLPPVGLGWADADGTLTLDAILPGIGAGEPYLRWRNGAGCCSTVLAREGWTCLGVATPHGRVMVGDGWAFLGGPEQVVTSVDAGGPRFANGAPAEPLEGSGWTRTRYAPARAGERYASRIEPRTITLAVRLGTGLLDMVEPDRRACYALRAGGSLDPAQWERLDGGPQLPEHGTLAEATALANELRRKLHLPDPPTLDAIHAAFCTADLGPVESIAIPSRGEVTVYLPEPPQGAIDRAVETEHRILALLAASTCFTVRWREAATVPTGEPYTLLQGQPVRRHDGGRIVGATFVADRADDVDARVRTVADYAARTARITIPITQAMRDAAALKLGAPSTLTLTGPARDLRALADAVGRALEATKPHSAVVAGQTYLVMRDEMLFRPEVAPAANVLVITADTKHLHALRALILAAMTGPPGVDHAGAWGKERVGVVVRREYRFEPATPPAADHSPTRYDGANGGADHWRWTVGE